MPKGLELESGLQLYLPFAINHIEFSVFMPRFYSAVSNVDLEELNSEKVALNLVYKGQCVNTHAFKVAIEGQ